MRLLHITGAGQGVTNIRMFPNIQISILDKSNNEIDADATKWQLASLVPTS